jgi:hypothetical protein
MSQEPQVAATADASRSGRALRPLLLLGGFVVLWWCLATGTAQADDSSHDLAKATRGLAGTVERTAQKPVHHVATRAAKATHPSASKAAHTVHQHAAPAASSPVIHTVEKTVGTSPAKPLLDAATAVRTKVAPALEQTLQTVDTAVLGTSVIPELEGLGPVAYAVPVLDDSSLQGETPSSPVVDVPVATPSSSTVAAASLAALAHPSAVALDNLDRVVPGSPAAPRDNHGLATLGGTSAATGESGSGSGVGAALCDTALDVGADATRILISSLADRHPVDPAYQPSSSPD